MTYKEDLDRVAAQGCADLSCDHKHDDEPLYLHSRCHVSAPVEASYHHGSIRFACSKCNSEVITVAVASKPN